MRPASVNVTSDTSKMFAIILKLEPLQRRRNSCGSSGLAFWSFLAIFVVLLCNPAAPESLANRHGLLWGTFASPTASTVDELISNLSAESAEQYYDGLIQRQDSATDASTGSTVSANFLVSHVMKLRLLSHIKKNGSISAPTMNSLRLPLSQGYDDFNGFVSKADLDEIDAGLNNVFAGVAKGAELGLLENQIVQSWDGYIKEAVSPFLDSISGLAGITSSSDLSITFQPVGGDNTPVSYITVHNSSSSTLERGYFLIKSQNAIGETGYGVAWLARRFAPGDRVLIPMTNQSYVFSSTAVMSPTVLEVTFVGLQPEVVLKTAEFKFDARPLQDRLEQDLREVGIVGFQLGKFAKSLTNQTSRVGMVHGLPANPSSPYVIRARLFRSGSFVSEASQYVGPSFPIELAEFRAAIYKPPAVLISPLLPQIKLRTQLKPYSDMLFDGMRLQNGKEVIVDDVVVTLHDIGGYAEVAVPIHSRWDFNGWKSGGKLELLNDGLIFDPNSGLLWAEGLDQDTHVKVAYKWISLLNRNGHGGVTWRMPRKHEIDSLFEKSGGARSIRQPLTTSGKWLWFNDVGGRDQRAGVKRGGVYLDMFAFGKAGGRDLKGYYSQNSHAKSKGGRVFAVASPPKEDTRSKVQQINKADIVKIWAGDEELTQK